MYQDQSIKVREAISWVISKICEHHADVLSSNQQLCDYFIAILIESLKDRPKISRNSCTAIEKLAESLQPVNQTQLTNSITAHFENMTNALL